MIASASMLDKQTVERYLGILQVGPGVPVLEHLNKLIQAQMTTVPFENISKLYYKARHRVRTIPDIQTYLNGIERFRFGGTCYANNFHFHGLLASLGYNVKLCSADMSSPDVHMVTVARMEDREYLVDVGYAAPFMSALPRDLKTDYTLLLGRDRYVLKPRDEQGRSSLELFRDGVPKHGYTVKPQERTLDFFAGVIASSFAENATFMNSALLARFWPNRSFVIHNLRVTEAEKSESTSRVLRGREELITEIERHFGITSEVTSVALQQLGDLKDPWS